MISRPDNDIVKKIPKKASFTVLISNKLLNKLSGTEGAGSVDIGKYSLILENPKEYDPIKDLKNIEEMFKQSGEDNLGSYTTYSFPERLLYEQHALEMRFLATNPSIEPTSFFTNVLPSDEFDSKEEEMIVNDRVRAAIKLTMVIIHAMMIGVPDIEDSTKTPGYIYKLSDTTTVGEKYTITKTEYELFGTDKVFVHEFVEMPKIEDSILDKFIVGDKEDGN